MRHASTQASKKEKRDPELWRKAQALRASRFFVGTTDLAPLAEKQGIFLTLIGLKPVSEASSGHWVPQPGGRRTVYDDPAAVGAFLESLGLAFGLRHDEHATVALVALQPESLAAYAAASAERDQIRIGELFGYPPSATAAFSAAMDRRSRRLDALLPLVEQERLEQSAGLPSPMFRYSRHNWRQEMAVERRWQSALRLYDLLES